MVHQHFMLVPGLHRHRERHARRRVRPRAPHGSSTRATRASGSSRSRERHSLDVDPDARVEDLPVGVRQRVEIIKTLYRRSDLLILDEPTAVLTPQETEELFDIMRSLQAGGHVDHLHHPQAQRGPRRSPTGSPCCDGAGSSARRPRPRRRSESLATMMVGRPVELEVEKGPATARRAGPRDQRPARSATTVASSPCGDLDLVVHAGEIVAVAGVQGNGQTELVEAITGLPPDGGRLDPDRRDRGAARPATRLRGWGRPRAGGPPRGRPGPGLHDRREPRASTPTTCEPFADGLRSAPGRDPGHRDRARQPVRRPDPERASTRSANLSGGNQQKVIVAREFSRPIKLLVAAQPTRGLDVGLDRVHPPAHRREARRGGRRPDRLHRARRGAGPGRPDRGDVPGPDRGHPRSGRGDARAARPATWAARAREDGQVPMTVPVGGSPPAVGDAPAERACRRAGLVSVERPVDRCARQSARRRGARGDVRPAQRPVGRRRFAGRLLVPVLVGLHRLGHRGARDRALRSGDPSGCGRAIPLKALGDSIKAVADAYGALLDGRPGQPGDVPRRVRLGRHRPDHQGLQPDQRDAPGGHPADLHRPGRRPRLPERPVQHRRRGPALRRRDLSRTFVGFCLHGAAAGSSTCRWRSSAGFLGGALWGFIPGLLKARTGAHEVIVTIMLNYIAYRLVDVGARVQRFYQRARPDRPDLADRRPGRCHPADHRRPAPRLGLRPGPPRRRGRLVAAVPLDPRLRVPGRRPQPVGAPGTRA